MGALAELERDLIRERTKAGMHAARKRGKHVSEGLRREEAVHLFGPAARLAEALQKRGVSAKLMEEAAKEAST